MIIIYGNSNSVSNVKWNGKSVWTTGLNTEWEVVKTYMGLCIMVVSAVEHLREDMRGIYVVNEGGADVSEEAVLRGGWCLNCSMREGLWRLRDLCDAL